MTTDVYVVGVTQCRQRLDRQGTEGVRYAMEVVNQPASRFYRAAAYPF